MFSLVILLLAAATDARAGSGPWVVSEGDLNVYSELEYQRISELAISSNGEEVDVIAVDDGIETFGAKAIATYGLRERIDLELQVPWYRAEANTTTGPICTTLGLQACVTTEGLGAVTAKVKGLLVDELALAPVSLSVAGVARFGAFTSDERARITNLGEGTTDLGGVLAVGRSGGLLDGFWSGWAQVGWLHRFPNQEFRGIAVPGGELLADAEVMAGARRWWSLGPSVSLLHRPEGVDFVQADVTSVDRFSMLRVTSLRGGGKLVLRSSERTALVLSGLTTLAAVNNPYVFSFGAGVSIQPRLRGGGADGATAR
jgi:hypothetical protein